MTTRLRVQFLHGLESSALGDKARFFAERFVAWTPTMDTRDFAGCVETQARAVADFAPDVLVGSSFGGAVAVELLHLGVHRGPTLLLAQASAKLGSGRSLPAETPVVLVHGTRDEVIPIDDSRTLARTGTPALVRLVEVDDDHRLRTLVTSGRLADLVHEAHALGRDVATRARTDQPPWTRASYQRALAFAAHAHGEQRVPGVGLPYVVHLANVAMEVLSAATLERFDVDLAMTCALLHDTLEDTGVDAAEIERRFGRAVLEGVRALTKDAALPKEARMADSLARIAAAPGEIAIVKLADRITNLQPPPEPWSPEKRAAYRDEARVILAALGSASPTLGARLAAKIEAYGAYLREA